MASLGDSIWNFLFRDGDATHERRSRVGVLDQGRIAASKEDVALFQAFENEVILIWPHSSSIIVVFSNYK